MPSTVYKGDLTEVSFGHETGLKLPHGYAGSFKFEHLSTDASANTSVISFSGGAASTPCEGGRLNFPVGMLVGCRLSIIGKGRFTADDTSTTGRTYSILEHKVHSTNNTELTVTPALKITTSTGADANESDTNDTIFIHAFGTPTFDANMAGWNITAADSSERVLTDQFLGLAATLTLPETKVDLKRFHVVGLGRDAAVQVPGRFLSEGGSFEVNLHNPRWLYYALGMESVAVGNQFDSLMTADRPLATATEIGETFITIGTAASTFVSGTSAIAAGDYVLFKNEGTALTYNTLVGGSGYTGASGVATTGGTGTGLVVTTVGSSAVTNVTITNGGHGYSIGDVITIAGGTGGTFVLVTVSTPLHDIITYDSAGDLGVGAEFGAANVGGEDYFNQVQGQEIRRIAAISGVQVWLDDGLCFPHPADTPLRFIRFDADGTGSTGSPHRASTGALTRGVTRCLYSRSTVPSFAMEVSIRRSDAEGSVSDVTDGSASDTKQLTRVFKGCKVKDFSLTADTDAALRMSVNFDSALCYTDTGRLENGGVATDYSSDSKGDRYMAHRMFEETAGTLAKRKEAGIEKGTQKPYMFYNGTVSIAGVTLGQVVSFTITGNTGVQQFYTINGAAITDSETDQIPFGGARNASLAIEGKTEYSMDCEIIVDDPVFYHKVRRAVGHSASTANMIRLSFTKPGTAAGRESIDILLDDFVITEAPLPIPEDKGVIKAPLKIMPKAMRVVATDTLLHS